MIKKLSLIILLAITMNVYSQDGELLRHWDSNANLISWSPDSAYTVFHARFELPRPGTLNQVDLRFSGDTGRCIIYLFGHEGGTVYPSYIQPLYEIPYGYLKTETGETKYSVYPDNVFLDNTQFWVVVTGMTPGMNLLMDDVKREPNCSSGSGGNNTYMLTQSQTAQISGPYAYAIDCYFDYESSATSPAYLKSVTTDKGLKDDIKCKTMAAADYNGDDYIDLLVTGNLYLNNGDGSFTDKTSDAGLSGTPASNIFADMDNDGNLDILFVDVENETQVYLGDGAGNFTKETLSDFPLDLGGVNGVSLTDLDKDGYLDVFIAGLASPWPQPAPNYLFYNKGSKSLEFEDKTNQLVKEKWTNSEYPQNPNRMSRGSMWIDYDNDGDQDLFIPNYRLHPDEFYKNNGDGTFTDICQEEGIDISENTGGSNHGTGVDWADYDNDGDMDLLLCQFAHPRYIAEGADHRTTTVYKNKGSKFNYSFEDTYDPEAPNGGNGIELEETFSGGTWGDVNNDGLVDFYETVYYGCKFVKLYIQNTDHTFNLKTWEYGIEHLTTGEDAIWADIDNDGDLDLITGYMDTDESYKLNLLENTMAADNNYIDIKLEAQYGNKFAVGARVKVYAGSDVYEQEINLGRGQLMQEPYRLHFGIGKNSSVDMIAVRWYGNQFYKEYSSETGNTFTINAINKLKQEEGSNINEITNEIAGSLGVSSYPNPAIDMVTFNISDNPYNNLKVTIYNTLGQQVKQLNINGNESVKWNFTNEAGNILAPAIYTCKFTAGEKSVKILRVIKN